MITNDKKKKKKNPPQQTIVNVFQVWTTCKEQCSNYFYTGIYMYNVYEHQCKWKEKARKFQTSRSKAPPYFVYNSASLWFTCCFHFTFSSCSRDASAVNCKQGTKLKQQTCKVNEYYRALDGMLHSFLTSVHKIHLKFAKCYETQVFKIS